MKRRSFLKAGLVAGAGVVAVTKGSLTVSARDRLPFVNGENYGLRSSENGLDPSNAPANTAALKAIRDMMQRGGAHRGGKIVLPRGGVYFFNDEIRFDADRIEKVHNIYLEGEGQQATVMDFSTAAPGKCGIKFGPGVGFGVRNLSIRSAPSHNIAVVGDNSGGSNYAARGMFENVRTQQAGAEGILVQNAFGIEMRSIWSTLNAGAGVKISGFSTTIAAYSCYSSDNKGVGWHIAGSVAAALFNCSADRDLFGFYIEGCTTVNIVSGYSEGCQKEAVYVRASPMASLPLALQEQVNGANLIKIDGFYALENSKIGLNKAANFLSVEGVSNQEATVEYTGAWSSNQPGQSLGARFNGTAGKIVRKPGINRIQGDVVDVGSVTVL
ncbi:hypothetical protein C6558_26165 [Ensifer sp. NM-2]|uniref:hypothetical protein n=1 Tax=Ensifer sp. NM-2 TaxID=2109730 RepID=UPI000D11DB46|nr:hypothetical protein [Ensifer sp. NM-2]PSS61540.1 hypothetical protein C6558_26165 [Ensifer sp. NM-2]